MAKKSEINKKGRLAKSTLSVVLAASMVLTSSSFVWAAPAGDIAVIEEGDAATEEVGAPVEENIEEISGASVKENVRAAENTIDVEVTGTYTYNGNEQIPALKFYVPGAPSVPITLNEGVDYELSLKNNTNAGTATATITYLPEGSYSNDAIDTATFSIEKASLSSATFSLKDHDGFVYDGTEQRPEISSASIKLNGATAPATTLTEGKDFRVVADTGSDLIKAKIDQTIKLEAIEDSNYEGTSTKTESYEIEAAEFNANTIEITSKKVQYTGSAAVADIVVKDAVTKDILIGNGGSPDYKIQYADAAGKFDDSNPAPADIGPHQVRIECLAGTNKNFKVGGYIITSYEIVSDKTLAMLAEDATLTGAGIAQVGGEWCFTYNGKKTGHEVTGITIGGLNVGTDIEVEYPAPEDYVNVGTYEVKVTGKNKYPGQTVTVPFKVVPMAINTAANSTSVAVDGAVTGGLAGGITMNVTLGTTHNSYEAEKATVVIIHTIDGEEKVLAEGTDYTYTTNKTTGKVVITGIGNYSTELTTPKTKTFTTQYAKIATLNLNDPSISAVVNGTYAYTGNPVEPAEADIVVTEGGYKLKMGQDFKVVKYYDNVKAGTARIEIQGVEDRGYTGTRYLTFQISGKSLSDTFTFKPVDDITYDGNAHKAVITSPSAGEFRLSLVNKTTESSAPSSVLNGLDIKYYRDGKVTTDFTKPGTITVEATAKSGQTYEGKVSVSYNIVGQTIGQVAKVEAIADQDYTGSAVTPDVKVVSKTGTATFTKDKDYTVTYSNNTDVGKATVIIQGIGYYSGQIVATFNIVGQMEQEIVVLPAQEKDLGNGSRTLKSKATVVKYTTAPKTDVTYASSNADVVKVDEKTGAITYTGVGTAKITISAAESETYKAATKELTVKVVPETPKNVKVTSTAKKKITVKAGEVKEAAKYQIRIQKSGHSSVYVNVDNKGDLSKVYTTKSSGKFNVWVRAYKTIGEKDHHFSAWSPKTTVTVK